MLFDYAIACVVREVLTFNPGERFFMKVMDFAIIVLLADCALGATFVMRWMMGAL